MFCHVSRAISAVVLKTVDVAKDFIGRTHTALGLHVVPEIARRTYQKGIKATRDFINHNPIRFSYFLPDLNYTAPWYGLI